LSAGNIDRRYVVRRLIEVAIIDPHAGIRAALEGLLDDEADLRVTAFRDVESFFAADRVGDVDVVLADERLAGVSSGAARAALKSVSKHAPVLVMGTGEPGSYAEAMTAAGAVGYWPKYGDIDTLIRTVRAAGLIGACDALGPRRRQNEPARRRAAAGPRRVTTSTTL
jgi:DNA-binding NarL/FixJ family response regulator